MFIFKKDTTDGLGRPFTDSVNVGQDHDVLRQKRADLPAECRR